MRWPLALGVFSGVLLAAAASLIYIRFGPPSVGGSTGEPPAEEVVFPAQPPVPDLTDYKPAPGCVLDEIYAKDGQVWSQFLNTAIRPITVTMDKGEQAVFPVALPSVALNCHDSVGTANPYVSPSEDPAKTCGAYTIRSENGWLVSDCPGVRPRPDIPLIIGTGEQILISGPLGPTGTIIADTFTAQ